MSNESLSNPVSDAPGAATAEGEVAPSSMPSGWQRLPRRVRASLTWLGASVIIASLLLTLVFGVWYPGDLARATGVGSIFAMMFGIDLTLGPFIILLIFNPAKKQLRLDVTLVAIVQLAALCYGVYTIAIVRPAFIVYNVDRFDVVLANGLDPQSAALAKDERFQSAPWTGPIMIGSKMPTDRVQRNKILTESVLGGYDLPQLPQYYVPLSEISDQIRSRLQPLEKLRKSNSNADPAVLAKLESYIARGEAVGFVPVHARDVDLTAVIDRKSATVLEILPLDPW